MLFDQNLRIFLADDDEDDREFFKQALRRVDQTAQVTEAVNGVDAIRHFQTNSIPPDMVFLDINMPLINGIECLREIRKAFSPEQLPIFMLSTSRLPAMINLSSEYGANLYLQKPGSLAKLAEQLRTCIDSADAGPEQSTFTVVK